MSKILAISYSYTGTCRRLTQLLCSQQNWAMGEIVDEQPRSGSLRCVLDSLLRRRPPIRYEGPPPADFDAVVLIAPIWMYRLAGPMRSFVAMHGAHMPHISVVSVMGGRGAANAFAEISQITGRAPRLATAFTAREVEDGSCAARLLAFGNAVEACEDTELQVKQATWSPVAA